MRHGLKPAAVGTITGTVSQPVSIYGSGQGAIVSGRVVVLTGSSASNVKGLPASEGGRRVSILYHKPNVNDEPVERLKSRNKSAAGQERCRGVGAHGVIPFDGRRSECRRRLWLRTLIGCSRQNRNSLQAARHRLYSAVIHIASSTQRHSKHGCWFNVCHKIRT